MLNIRLAKDEDIKTLVEISRDLHKSTTFTRVSFDKDVVLEVLYSLISGPVNEKMLVVAENKDKEIVGTLGAMLVPSLYSSSKLAIEPLFWTNGNPKVFKVLVECFEDWAKNVGADFTLIGAGANHTQDKWSRVYKRLGYNPYQSSFIKELN